ncbi:30S ribosomal protein S9 [uncultured archaeon]|nr:30S ribosomal protein S9 [uncultured archaeon]
MAMNIVPNKVVSGKRKTAIAKATAKPGNGKVMINDKIIEAYPMLQQLELKESLIIAEQVLGKLDMDIDVNVKSGGTSSQIEAARLAIARVIVEYTKNDKVRQAFISYDRSMLVADTRRKEAYKPGDSKARAKRQTSYR